MFEFDRITFDPQLMSGRACIRGMRITASLIVNLVANGMTMDEILRAYPYLERDDIAQALRYAGWLAEDLDFGDLLAASGEALPSVVIFRLRNMRPDSVNRYLFEVIDRFQGELEAGAIITVSERGMRVRELPIIPNDLSSSM